jgi:hypothetical protein
MSYLYLFNRAHALCIKANSHAIAHSLQVLSKAELICVVSFSSQIVN